MARPTADRQLAIWLSSANLTYIVISRTSAIQEQTLSSCGRVVPSINTCSVARFL